jgi:hypothetical protein
MLLTCITAQAMIVDRRRHFWMILISKNLKVDGMCHFQCPRMYDALQESSFQDLEVFQGSGGHQVKSTMMSPVGVDFQEMDKGNHAGISRRTKQ